MSTQQINIRIDLDLAAALDRVAREESLDRATAIRRLLERSVKTWELEHAVLGIQRGDVSLGRGAEEAGLSTWDLVDAVRVAGVAHPLTGDEARARLDRLAGPAVEGASTLPDRAPREGGVVLVGINPAPASVSAGHYYQGRLGRRLWRRLEGLGLLRDPEPGSEDDGFVSAGNGLTDLVKRPTAAADLLSSAELEAGADSLREKIREWRPGLVLFAFRAPAEALLGTNVAPGRCGEVEGAPRCCGSAGTGCGASPVRETCSACRGALAECRSSTDPRAREVQEAQSAGPRSSSNWPGSGGSPGCVGGSSNCSAWPRRLGRSARPARRDGRGASGRVARPRTVYGTTTSLVPGPSAWRRHACATASSGTRSTSSRISPAIACPTSRR